jgi:hypothetical protein
MVALARLFVIVVAIMAVASHARSAPPAPLWRTALAENSTFGDPTTWCDFDGACSVAVMVAAPNGSVAAVAFDAADGSVRWQHALNTSLQSFSGWLVLGAVEGAAALFGGTDCGVVALRCADGAELWRHAGACSAVVAHPTFADARIFYTHESGVNSSGLTILNANNGAPLYGGHADEELVFTLIWVLRLSGRVAYCARNATALRLGNVTGVQVVTRAFDGAAAWAFGGQDLSWSQPGLWDNPNLVVDASDGAVTYMYSKPRVGDRRVTALDSATGRELWAIADEPAQFMLDYDTFAWAGGYYRVYTAYSAAPSNTSSPMAMEKRNGTTGALVWRVTVPSVGSNVILLVARGYCVAFHLQSGSLAFFAEATGAYLGARAVPRPSTGVFAAGGRPGAPLTMLVGSATGAFYAIGVPPLP